MNSLSGFNSQEMRRLHPYLSALLSRLKALEVRVEAGKEMVWGADEDIQPTGNENLAGSLNRVARADHQHLFKFPTSIPFSTPDGTAFFDLSTSAINIYVDDTPTTRVVAGGTEGDVQPTGRWRTGEVPRYSYADHSHPTALLPEDDPQTPVEGEIRYNAEDKLVRWNGSEWVEMSVEDAGVETGTDADVRPTRLRSAGSSSRLSRADHSHPTAILPQGNAQSPEPNEIRYNTDNKLVRWDASTGQWVLLSVETFTINWATTSDVQPTRLRSTGTSTRVARADHSHPTAILPQGNTQTPVADEIRYNTNNKLVRWSGSGWVQLSVEEVEGGTKEDVQPTKWWNAGEGTRFARADHSHPTAILPEEDSQEPVEDEIRYNTDNKLVRWDKIIEQWVPLSVETFEVEWGTNNDVQPTRLQSAGTATLFARADHSHPTAILPEDDPQPPVEDEIRYNTDNKLVRWDGSEWVGLSVDDIPAGLISDVQPTRLRSAGTSVRYARADHSHPTALLPMTNSQTPVVDELRYKGANRLVRWTGSSWTDIATPLPVPADPLVLPFDNEVSNPLNRQLLNHSFWDDIGNATVFYYDTNHNQPRLVYARPLVVATSSTPSGKNVWSIKTNELVLKHNPMDVNGATGVLWSRGGNTAIWSPVATQLLDSDMTTLPTDVGVLARSPLTGTSGSRRWFLRGAQENGFFRAPFAGIASFTSATTPAPTNLSTTLDDGYAYFVYDIDRIDVVKPTTNGNKHPMMLTHSIIAPVCRTFITTADPSGHYVRDEQWNSIWVVAFRTTTSATTNLVAILPTMTLPIGVQAGRVLLYLHNPQSAVITPIFALTVRTPTNTGVQDTSTLDVSVSIPANRTVIVDLGFLSFPPSTTLSHHRSFPITPLLIRRRASEASNAHTVFCLAVVIVPQREA